jgi:hypothetical protein
MVCFIEFSESMIKSEFCGEGKKQRILVDMLLKYGDMNIDSLAKELEVPIEKVQHVLNGHDFFIGDREDSLAQFFLMFFGRLFFKKFTLIRHFT